MPETTLIGPDGKEYTVTHPEGATEQEIIAYTRQKVASGEIQADAPERPGTGVTDIIDATPEPLRMLANLPGSAMDLYNDTVMSPMQDPMGTMKGIGQLAGGTLQKFQDAAEEHLGPVAGFSPLTMAMDKAGMDYRAAPEAVMGRLADRYGSGKKAVETLQEDPAGVLADLSVLTPLGAKSRVSTANKLRSAAEDMYGSAAKFPKTLTEAENQRMVRTALDAGVRPTASGVRGLQEAVDKQAAVVNQILERAETMGGKIPLAEVLRPLLDLRRERGASLAGGRDASAAVTQFIRDRIEDARRQGKTELSVKELQQLKLDLYDQINWNAKRQIDEVPVLEDARKTYAGAARSNIERLAPEVSAENRKLGDMLELQPHLERASRRIEDRDLVGLPEIIGGAGSVAAAGAGGGLPSIIPLAVGVANNPRVMSRLAMAVDKLGRATVSRKIDQFMRENPNASAAAIAAYVESMVEDEDPRGALYQEEAM